MGEKQNQPFQLSFNPSLKVDFQGSRVTSDSGLLLVRELDERLGLSALIAENIRDGRSAAKYVLWRVGVRSGVAKVGRKWRNFVCAGSESRTVGGDPDDKCFTLTRTVMEGDNGGLMLGSKRRSQLVRRRYSSLVGSASYKGPVHWV